MKDINVDEVIQAPGAEYDLQKESIKQEINCARPGIVRDYDPETQTATIELAVRGSLGGQFAAPPLLTDVPVFFPGGKNGALVFDIEKGDECLVVFSDVCIDAWFQNGGISNPVSLRRHDLSDGFAFVGFRSRPNALPNGRSDLFLDKSRMLDAVYPVGAVYTTVTQSDPADLFGGAWERISETSPYMWSRVR